MTMTNSKSPILMTADGKQYTYVLQDEGLQQVEVTLPAAPSPGVDDRIHSKITFPAGGMGGGGGEQYASMAGQPFLVVGAINLSGPPILATSPHHRARHFDILANAVLGPVQQHISTVLSRVGVTMTPRSPSQSDSSQNRHYSDETAVATSVGGGRPVKIFERLLYPCYALTLLLAILLVVIYVDLRSVRAELKALQNLVEHRLAEQSPGTAELKYEKRVPGGSLTEVTTASPVSSSTERDKREIEVGTAGYPLLAHYTGGLPESIVGEGGLISPWFMDRIAEGEFALKNTMKEGRGSVEVTESGLYFIYAQVFYVTSSEVNSYSIVLKDELNRDLALATCSTPGNETGETSCYTASARYLTKGDRLQVKQRERNRLVLLREDQTFLGMVLLRPSL